MRVLHVNTSAQIGGAAIAVRRLSEALRSIGVESDMLVCEAKTGEPHVFSIAHPQDESGKSLSDVVASARCKAAFVFERAEIFAQNGFSRRQLFAADTASFGTDITTHPAFCAADIIHLHWINQGFLSLAGIRKILENGKPVVWTLHDMWSFTGICHYSGACAGYLKGCGNCRLLGSAKKYNDLSHRTFLRKKAVYNHGRILFVGCSQWIAGIARQAPLLEGMPVEAIPNALDTNFFAPGDKTLARRTLNLPEDKHLLLFVAHKATSPLKGADYLIEALRRAYRRGEIDDRTALVVAGQEAEALQAECPIGVIPLSYVNGDEAVRTLYRAADVLALPSLEDNLPNTCAEATACGLPTVAFHTGGIPQMIDNGTTGRLVRLYDVDELGHSLSEVLYCMPEEYKLLAQAARKKALPMYNAPEVAKLYRELYMRLIYGHPVTH